jgi:iron complex outermembrane receptor protein
MADPSAKCTAASVCAKLGKRDGSVASVVVTQQQMTAFDHGIALRRNTGVSLMKKFYLMAAALATVVPVAAPAQDTGALEEIVVTAQRREQSLQDVPISVTAFSADALEKSNIRGATDYLAMTPNVSFTEDAQSGSRGLGLAIRGVNNLVSGENAFVNSVGNYLDEFSIASVPSGVANPLLIDMDRVEVLRGPQGTYFGRNSLGGALNLTTRAPTDEYEGQVTLGGESYATTGAAYNITGIFNAPLGDAFKVRGVAFYEDSSGMVENIGPGASDSGHKWTDLRVRAVWEPSDRTKLGLTLMYSKQDQGADETVPSGYVDLDTVDTFGFQPGTAFDPGTGFWPKNQDKFSHDLDESNKLDTTVAIVNFAQKISDGMTFKAVAGVIDATQKRLFDNDLIGNLDVLKRTNKYDGNSWSVEARLEATNEKFDWVVGALYAKDQQEQDNNVAVSSTPTATIMGVGFLPPFPAGLGLARNTKNFEVESVAVFADATWHVNDQLDLILGARQTNDDVLNERTAFGIAPSCGCGPSNPAFFPSFINFQRPNSSGKVSFDDFAPRAGLRVILNERASVYATVSKGYKAGGTSTGNDTNRSGAAIALDFKEEQLWNYEVGLKMESEDRRVRVNASIFAMNWQDLQVEAFRFLTAGDLSSNFEQTVNVDAKAKGFEIEVLGRATDRLTVGGALGYLDTEIVDEPVCDVVIPGQPTCIQITGGFAVTAVGLDMPKSPKLTLNMFGEYRWPIGSNSAWLRGEYMHRDSQYSDLEALTNRQTRGPSPNQGLVRVVGPGEFPYKVPAFSVFNLRGGYDWERASVNVYVRNAFDEDYYTGTQENFGLSGIRLRPHPRTIGASVTFKF